MPTERKKLLLRLDPAVHDALTRWASDELRSTNAQIEFLLRRALGDSGRLPGNVGRIRRPGRPPAQRATDDDEPDVHQSDEGTDDHEPVVHQPDVHTVSTQSDQTETETFDRTEPRSADHTDRTTNTNHEEP